MSGITTHVLDTSRGKPAAGIAAILELRAGGTDWKRIGQSKTDADGRAKDLLPESARVEAGTYRLRFDSGAYFRALGIEAFYPEVVIEFVIHDVAPHYHVPLLLGPFGYTTYRGS